jgi:hypothetical protein
MAGFNKKTGRRPPTQWPFPRDVTRKVTPSAYEPGDSADDARDKWETWLRVVAGLRQMTIPARSKGRRFDK